MLTKRAPSTIRPMLCHDAHGDLGVVPTDGWIMEPKMDGWRWMISREEDGVRSIGGRNGNDLSGQAPDIEAALEFLPVGTILDGEIVNANGGHSATVSTLLAHPHMGQLVFTAFDVLAVAGQSTEHMPWRARRALLEMAAGGFDGVNVTISKVYDVDRSLFDAWLAAGFEGCVAKRAQSTYAQGKRSRDWLKVKPQTTADAVVIGLVPGKGHLVGQIGAFRLRMLDGGCETACGTGAHANDATEHPERWLGRTIEILHHGLFEGGQPRHPVFSRLRPDLEEAS